MSFKPCVETKTNMYMYCNCKSVQLKVKNAVEYPFRCVFGYSQLLKKKFQKN